MWNPDPKGIVNVPGISEKTGCIPRDNAALMNEVIERSIHGCWWCSHGRTGELQEVFTIEMEYRMYHNDTQGGDYGGRVDGVPVIKVGTFKERGDFSKGMLCVDVGIHRYSIHSE